MKMLIRHLLVASPDDQIGNHLLEKYPFSEEEKKHIESEIKRFSKKQLPGESRLDAKKRKALCAADMLNEAITFCLPEVEKIRWRKFGKDSDEMTLKEYIYNNSRSKPSDEKIGTAFKYPIETAWPKYHQHIKRYLVLFTSKEIPPGMSSIPTSPLTAVLHELRRGLINKALLSESEKRKIREKIDEFISEQNKQVAAKWNK